MNSQTKISDLNNYNLHNSFLGEQINQANLNKLKTQTLANNSNYAKVSINLNLLTKYPLVNKSNKRVLIGISTIATSIKNTRKGIEK